MARSAGRREALRRPQMEERDGSILWRPPAYSLFILMPEQRTHRSTVDTDSVRVKDLGKNPIATLNSASPS